MLSSAQAGPLPKRRWRDTLQGRLIASHVLVILLALGLVVASSAVFLRRYERTAEEERLAQLAVPLIAEVNVARLGNSVLEGGQRLRVDAIDAQADAMDLRILILDVDGTVRYDTSEDENLRKQALPQFSSVAADVVERAQSSRKLQYEFISTSSGDAFGGQRLLIAAGQTGQWQAKRALVLISDSKRFPLIGLFLPRLFLVTGISLILASILGLVFSRRISLPVQRLTTAADAMAAGNLEQQVVGTGPDEIGRLVGSFNTMSRQVSATHRSQRELLADVAHELRTPLTSVQGYAQALKDNVIDDSAGRDQALTVIGREAERMSALIGQLLDLARLESGQSKLAFRPVAVPHLIDRVMERFRPTAARKRIVFTGSAPPDLLIHGDENRLVQLLSNLVGNAMQHTPADGLVSVNACSVDVIAGGGPGVRLIVHDTGEGIEPELLPRIFDRFERGQSTDDRTATGFGLGLAIVRRLTDLHHGSISVHSELGRGSTFTLDLPSIGRLDD